MKVSLTELDKVVSKAIKHYGYNRKEAEIIKNILMYAQLRGNNQGIVKLIGAGIPKRKEAGKPIITKQTPVSVLLDGNKTHAMIVMDRLADLAIKKARKSGMGIAGNFNTDESTGALGYYVNKIAKEGLIGVAFASAPFKTTAPYGSNEAMFCTNPLAYGIPIEEDPIVLDMTTSAMAYYGLIEAKTAGRKVPSDIGFDKDGNETTDPAEIMSGALKAFGDHKGSGLALVVQVLAGVFVRADSFDNDSDNAGNLVIAINPNIFLDTETFKNNVSEIVSKVKAARKIEGVEEIYVPGEKGNAIAETFRKEGEIEIEDNLYNELLKVAKF
ncbi:MAG: Ldh family oxidoreductase [Candidatus Dojkabacteria bacterium]